MATKIQVRRGLKKDLPALDVGEPGFATDTKEFYVGSPTGNVKVNGSGGGGEVILDDASLTTKGIVMLNSSIISSDETTAATPKAIKTLGDNFSNLFESIYAEIDALQPQIDDTNDAIDNTNTDITTHKENDVAHNRYGTDTGTANAKVVTLNPVPKALVNGLLLRFKNAVANTGAVTLNLNNLGAKSILMNGGTALAAGALKANWFYTVMYDGTNFILLSEGSGSSGKKWKSGIGKMSSDKLTITGLDFKPSFIIVNYYSSFLEDWCRQTYVDGSTANLNDRTYTISQVYANSRFTTVALGTFVCELGGRPYLQDDIAWWAFE